MDEVARLLVCDTDGMSNATNIIVACERTIKNLLGHTTFMCSFNLPSLNRSCKKNGYRGNRRQVFNFTLHILLPCCLTAARRGSRESSTRLVHHSPLLLVRLPVLIPLYKTNKVQCSGMNMIRTPLDMNSAEQYRQLELALEIYRESICRRVSSIAPVNQLYFYSLAFLSLELDLKQIATNSTLSSLVVACSDDKGCIPARRCLLYS